MCRMLPTVGDPICTRIFHTSAKDTGQAEDRQAGPIRAVLPRSRHLFAGRPDFPRRGKRRENTTRAPGAPLYVPGHRGSDLPARLMTVIDPRDTSELPAIDLPGTRAATRCRPAPGSGLPGLLVDPRAVPSVRTVRVNPLGWSHRRALVATPEHECDGSRVVARVAVDAGGAATAGWRSVPVAGWVRVLGC